MWASTRASGTERQRPRQRAASLAGRRDTTFRSSASGRTLMRSTPSAGAPAAASGAAEDTGGLGMASYANVRNMATPSIIGSGMSTSTALRWRWLRMLLTLTPMVVRNCSSMVAAGFGAGAALERSGVDSIAHKWE